MSNLFTVYDTKLVRRYENEKLIVEAWGENSVRVRLFFQAEKNDTEDWALTEDRSAVGFQVELDNNAAEIQHGKLTMKIDPFGKISFFRTGGELLFEEYVQSLDNRFSVDCSALAIKARELKPVINGDFYLTVRFSANPEERLYGMGQYQQPFLDLKGCLLELAQRNSQASVPFVLSNKGYGFLWNNPAVGRVHFGKNVTQWEATSTKTMDYWVTCGDSPAEIEQQYARATGKVPMMPEYGMGFWQSKLRYQTQDELLSVARKYQEIGQKIDVLVLDFFHWEHQGDWQFDPVYWPDPDAMIKELNEMGITLMVSVWPTVEKDSVNYQEMKEKGYFIHMDRGPQIALDFVAPTTHCDMTNPEARAFLWDACKTSYYDRGVKTFWLDVAEPEYTVYEFDNYRYYQGTNLQIGNLYPLYYAKTFYDGMQKEGQENVVNLLRCAWAGSQKYGTLVWSGDIHSSFDSMRKQLAAGLNMGIAGIPWWTTDIGGFQGGIPEDASFRELFARWFAWGAFCPVMRLHGDREPKQPKLGTTGGCNCLSGADNEIWSYGEEIYQICVKYLNLRERMRNYTRALMQEAHETGTPIIRTMFYEYPDDPICWEADDQYFYGSAVLVAPVLHEGQTQRSVYLPAGTWLEYETQKTLSGGQWVTADTPIDRIPIYFKGGKSILE